MHLVFEAVDGVDDVIVSFKLEHGGIFGGINLLHRVDFGVRVDFKQPLLQHLHLNLPHCLGRRL